MNRLLLEILVYSISPIQYRLWEEPMGWHGGIVVSAIALQQEGPRDLPLKMNSSRPKIETCGMPHSFNRSFATKFGKMYTTNSICKYRQICIIRHYHRYKSNNIRINDATACCLSSIIPSDGKHANE